MKEREYFVVLPFGYLTIIEITSERRKVIEEIYNGDVVEYYEHVILEEFDFSQSDTWSIVTESCMRCYGTVPEIAN